MEQLLLGRCCLVCPDKTIDRSQAGMSEEAGGGVAAAKAVIADEGIQGLYTGYTSNVAYAFPADAIKFLVRR